MAIARPSNAPLRPEPSATKASGEFEMTDADFRRIADKVFRTAGIVLKDHKRQMVYTRLARRLRALGMTSFTVYMDHLESAAGADEQEEFSNAVTTNLTSFFRERHHFDHLRARLLEPAAREGRRRLRIWSAGCSTGEEPYTIAMTAQSAGALARDFRILATDLDTNVLARAGAGVYRADRTRDIPAEMKTVALRRLSAEEVEVVPALRAAISFRQLNLLHAWPFQGPFDAIFCRNVLIYFDAETKAELVRRFAGALAAGGTLYLGHSESLLGEHPLLISEGRTIYRRRP